MRVELDTAKKVLGDFRIAPPAALDPEIYEKVRAYKEQVAARFISIGQGDVDSLPGDRFYISRKLDGEHNHLYYEDGRATLVKPGGATLHGLPVLDEAERVLAAAGVRSCIIPGELIVEKPRRGGGYERTRIYDVIKLLNEPASRKELKYFNFAPFDVLEIDGEAPESFEIAYQRLKTIFAGSSIRPVETVVSRDHETIHRVYEDWVKAGGEEGLMIRSDLPFRYKLKAAHLFDAAVVGYRVGSRAGEGDGESEIAGLLLALMHPNGLFQILCTVSDGIEANERRQLAERLRGLEINSEYIHVDKYHASYRMVAPAVVVEINCDDILTKHIDGRPYRKMVLEYHDGSGGLKAKSGKGAWEGYRTYKPVRNAAFVGLQRTSFVRFRDDKKVRPADLRVSQVTDLVLIEAEKTADFRRENLPASKVLAREVYIRPDAKSPAVRKLVAWKTNKEQADPAYSAYVVHFTDFSPGRAEPLQRELALTDDPGQVAELMEVFRKRCRLRGWELYADAVPETHPATDRGGLKGQARRGAAQTKKKTVKASVKKAAKAPAKKAGKKDKKTAKAAQPAAQQRGIGAKKTRAKRTSAAKKRKAR